MTIFSSLRQAYLDSTNSYRAGMGLPPLERGAGMPEGWMCRYCSATMDPICTRCHRCLREREDTTDYEGGY